MEMEMIEQFPVTNRWTGAVQFTAEIAVTPDMTPAVKLGLAVKWGVANKADLARADLADANLAGAYLAGADLADAYLADANLARANLADANLARANLAGANLARANLADANLAGAYLARAYLADAYLAGANLAGAYLARAKWREGVTISRPPIQIYGLAYPVTILDAHMQIGCECHSLAEWQTFDNERIARMDGKTARVFWDAHKETLLGLARADERTFAEQVSA